MRSRFGKRGTSDVTVDKIALDQLLGPARVIDVRDLVEGPTAVEPGKSRRSRWSACGRRRAKMARSRPATW